MIPKYVIPNESELFLSIWFNTDFRCPLFLEKLTGGEILFESMVTFSGSSQCALVNINMREEIIVRNIFN